ncbi:MAG: cell wall hydrolase, partial [Lachnospiraceae bacterium]|nr:cell wall hydrolase [Lachnospiraceae bacterium]
SGVSIVGNAAVAIGLDHSLTTAGVADILDANISMEKEELIAYAKNSVKAEKKEESTLVMAKVNEFVNMRQEADQDAEKVGVLYKDCGGEIVEQKAEWTKVKSGDVTGWIKNEYLYFGNEAKSLAEDVGMLTAYSETETLRVRMDADMQSGVLGLLANGEAVEAIAEEGDWVSVNYEGTKGYVAKEYVKVVFDIDKAESMAVIRAREEAERARAAAAAEAEKAKAAAEAKRVAQKEAVLATASEVDILAALIQCEAGGEPYEGQVAVGAVVMNRVRSGGYPNTITDVIYASGQFVPASKGKMESLILNGNIKASCVQAANEVINGACNVGDALHFRRNNGRDGLVIGNHVFY